MSKARMAQKDAEGKSMTQKDLATKVNEKPSVIQDYENGKASAYSPSLHSVLSVTFPLLFPGVSSLFGTQ